MRGLSVLLICIFTVLFISPMSFADDAPQAKAVAFPLDGIVIDGDLSDWPDGLEKHYILNVGDPYGPTDLDGVDLMTSEDLSPSFQVAYSATENLIYVAVTVRDDYMATGFGLNVTDGFEIYIEGTKRNRVNKPQERRFDSKTLAAIQYVMATPGGSYDMKRPGAPEPKNPRMIGGDISETRTKCGHSRSGNITIWEMAVDPYDQFPDTRTKLEPGRIIGMDVVLNDVDEDDGVISWVCWGPYKPLKFFDATSLGEIILAGKPGDLQRVSGTVKDKRNKAPFAGYSFSLFSGEEMLGMSSTDANGKYELLLPPGSYSLTPNPLQGIDVESAKKIKVKSGKDIVANFTPKAIKLPKALIKSAALYKGLTSYRDSTYIEIIKTVDDVETTILLPYTITFQKPKMLRIESSAETEERSGSFYLSEKESVSYYPLQKRYLRKPVPSELNISTAEMPVWEMSGNAIDLHFILSENPMKELLKNVSSIRDAGKETIDGEKTYVVELDKTSDSFTSTGPQMMSMVPRGLTSGNNTVKLWIGAKDYLIKRVSFKMDVDEIARSLPPMMKEQYRGKEVITLSHRNIETNAAIPGDTFTFKPPYGAEAIRMMGGRAPSVKPTEKKLGGKPAPDFTLADLDGVEMTLSDSRGRVVVVEFWASWNDKCIESMKKLQKVHEQFDGENVDVIGINTLDGEDADVLKEFLAEHGIKYRNLIDAEEDVVEKFGFTKIPVCFLIDKKGMVRMAFTTPPEDGAMLAIVRGLLAE